MDKYLPSSWPKQMLYLTKMANVCVCVCEGGLWNKGYGKALEIERISDLCVLAPPDRHALALLYTMALL